jgi:hypothetical protein
MVHGLWFMVYGSWFMVHGWQLEESWKPQRIVVRKLQQECICYLTISIRGLVIDLITVTFVVLQLKRNHNLFSLYIGGFDNTGKQNFQEQIKETKD